MDMKLLVRAQRDRVAAGVCVVVGAVALLIGWIGVSGNALVYKQLAYVVSGGLFGIALIGIGTTLWLSADLTDEWRKLDRIDEALRAYAKRDALPPLPEVAQFDDLAPHADPVASAPVRRRTVPVQAGVPSPNGAADDIAVDILPSEPATRRASRPRSRG